MYTNILIIILYSRRSELANICGPIFSCMITLTLYQVGREINSIHGSELTNFSSMALIICTLVYIK